MSIKDKYIEDRIKMLKITDNERQIQEELKKEEQLKKTKLEDNEKKSNQNIKLQEKDKIILGIIGVLIFLCIVILIKENRKGIKKWKESR